jgi:hypothetical protein
MILPIVAADEIQLSKKHAITISNITQGEHVRLFRDNKY